MLLWVHECDGGQKSSVGHAPVAVEIHTTHISRGSEIRGQVSTTVCQRIRSVVINEHHCIMCADAAGCPRLQGEVCERDFDHLQCRQTMISYEQIRKHRARTLRSDLCLWMFDVIVVAKFCSRYIL